MVLAWVSWVGVIVVFVTCCLLRPTVAAPALADGCTELQGAGFGTSKVRSLCQEG